LLAVQHLLVSPPHGQASRGKRLEVLLDYIVSVATPAIV